MTTKVETSARLQLSDVWEVTDINHNESQLFSKKFTNKKKELFRIGMKLPAKNLTSNRPPIFFLLTNTNLQKSGLRVLSVTYWKYCEYVGTTWRVQEIEMSQKDLTNEEKNNKDENDGSAGIQLFTAPLDLENDETDLSFNFTVIFTGIVDNFRIHHLDDLLRQQLQISKKKQKNWASFKLITTDGKRLRVHKWMLIARSPVFAALFSSNEEIESFHLTVDCTVSELSQFIHFIYTGELKGLVNHALMQLAAEYQIKTLKDICHSAPQDALSSDKMAIIALHLSSGSHLTCNQKNEPDEELFDILDDNVSIFACTWNVQNIGADQNQEPFQKSVSFEHGGKKISRAWLEMTKSLNHPGKYTFSALKFLSYGHESICSKIAYVFCSIDGPDQNIIFTHQKIRMNETKQKDGNTSLQVFTGNLSATELITQFSCPFVITFHVELSTTVASLITKSVDLEWNEQLWATAINKKMTDVEFLVGEESFGAHRSLLSARSPVFAAMFQSGMKEAETGRVRIVDVDPSTFERFLKFLYTGMLESSASDEELFTVADKYRVETLIELCRPATQQAATDDGILKAFLSL